MKYSRCLAQVNVLQRFVLSYMTHHSPLVGEIVVSCANKVAMEKITNIITFIPVCFNKWSVQRLHAS